MSSQHADPPYPVRAPAAQVALAKVLLEGRGWSLTAFTGACLAAVIEEPDRVLEMIAVHRPAGKRLGRPPANAETGPGGELDGPGEAAPRAGTV